MIRKLCILIFISLSFTISAQKADDLNEQSKIHLELGEFDKALPLINESAELGNREAQYNLGYFYQSGIVVERNQQLANEWYAKSAENGYTDGLYQLMMAYGNGEGVQKDVSKAFNYALKCAENGDGTCMFNVASCYKSGTGVEQDLAKMLEWSTRLAKQENPENLTKSGFITSSRLELAYMYRDGDFVKQSNFISYQWFLIYNEFKRDFSYFQQQGIVKEILAIEKTLSKPEIDAAKLEAEKLLGRNLENLLNLHKAEI